MTTINRHRPEEIREDAKATSTGDIQKEKAAGIDKEEAIKRLREQELKLNYVVNKGLTNVEVEKIKNELSTLIKELEAI